MTAIARPIARPMTRDEFVSWNAPGELRWQLIDGEAMEMAPTSRYRGAIQAELTRLIANFLVGRPDAQVVCAAGVTPRVRADMNFRIPDLAVTFEVAGPAPFLNEPAIMVEILSPSNEPETRANVWAYTTIPSVQEVLLVRSSRVEAELLRRTADGSWPADPVVLRGDASLTLDSIEFSTPLAALYRTTGLSGAGPTK